MLDGEIDSSAAMRVEEVLKQVGSDGADVYVNSPGGNLLVGMQIGRMLRKAGVNTYIGTLGPEPLSSVGGQRALKHIPGYCHSACSLAYLGGIYRYAGKQEAFGVHRFSSSAAPSPSDLDTAQVISAALVAYIREMDVDPGLFDLMVERGKDGIRLLTSEELARLHVVNNGRLKPEWTIESIEAGQYLRGIQESALGAGKAVFFCRRGEMGFYSFYQAGSKLARRIEQGDWQHSLLLDDQTIALRNPTTAKAAGAEISAEFSLTQRQALQIASSSRLGHAMQLDRDAPTFVGYQIDIPPASSQKVGSFMRTCFRSAR